MKYLRIVIIPALLFSLAGCGIFRSPVSRTEDTASAYAGNSPQHRYIRQYAGIAVRERTRSGIPASITLAQGMLESGNGMSELAVRGNNHFGIKCHDWTGGKIYYDDDRKGECFRKYRTAEESYRDHSDFLRYRDRYKFLFDFNVTDYKSWAYGLKKAGYATDPAYPQKLIGLIEDYGLDRFDKPAGKSSVHGGSTLAEAVPRTVNIPATPAELETPRPISDRQGNAMRLSLSRQLYSQNGVPFVYSVEGETYADIARYYNLFLKEILRYNDLDDMADLLPGTVVYLQPKKAKAARHVEKYVAEGGEQLRDIAQRYAVRMKKLMKLNGKTEPGELLEGEMIILRK